MNEPAKSGAVSLVKMMPVTEVAKLPFNCPYKVPLYAMPLATMFILDVANNPFAKSIAPLPEEVNLSVALLNVNVFVPKFTDKVKVPICPGAITERALEVDVPV